MAGNFSFHYKMYVPFCLLIAVSVATSLLCQNSVLPEPPGLRLFLFNLFSAFLIFSMLPRRAYFFVAAGQALFSLFCVTYEHALGRSPTLTEIVHGIQYIGPIEVPISSYVRFHSLMIYFSLFILQLLLIRAVKVIPFRRWLFSFSLIALVGLQALTFITRQSYSDFMTNETSREVPPERYSQYWRGLLGSFAIEALSSRMYTLKSSTPARSDAVGIELLPRFDFWGKLALIQVESLDYDLLNASFEEGGVRKYVMPFLHELSDKSFVLKLDGTKKIASSNSDYEIFTGRIANSVVHYEYETNYADSILSILSEKYPVSVFVGVFGAYMNMRNAYKLQGVQHTYFVEEMKKEMVPFSPDVWDKGLVGDADTFKFALSKIPKDKNFAQFIITMNMHTVEDNPVRKYVSPLLLFENSEKPAFYTEAYTTDEAIKMYVDGLPKKTLVVIWGDHNSYGNKECRYVPFIIYMHDDKSDVFFEEKEYTHHENWTRSKMYFYLLNIITRDGMH